MRERGGGTVINIGSDSGLLGAFGQSNYAAAKGAILGLTLTWARELPRHGITCNCVLPNALTAMTEGLHDLLAAYRYGPPEQFPRALGEAVEAAPLIVLLAGERWSRLNGRLLSLGGDKLSVWEPPAEAAHRVSPRGLVGRRAGPLASSSPSVVGGLHPGPAADANTHLEPTNRSLDGAAHC